MLQAGPVKLTAKDLCTLLDPDEVKTHRQKNREIFNYKNFHPGWLSDVVSIILVCHSLHVH